MFHALRCSPRARKATLKMGALSALLITTLGICEYPLLGSDAGRGTHPPHSGGSKSSTVDEDMNTREQMLTWSRQLGITCVHCHNLENFKSFEKKNMHTAKEHSKWVNLLNTQGHYPSSPKVDCYMCHQSHPIPLNYKEKQE